MDLAIYNDYLHSISDLIADGYQDCWIDQHYVLHTDVLDKTTLSQPRLIFYGMKDNKTVVNFLGPMDEGVMARRSLSFYPLLI